MSGPRISLNCGCSFNRLGGRVDTCLRHVSHHQDEIERDLVRRIVAYEDAACVLLRLVGGTARKVGRLLP